ncbi:hypothetical protein ACQP1S_02615 [Micromonospora matsumotoense]|uniref:hypothetical protein n=1 Tax=Micromonospora matsumotoense TaxID=121616 RepID=UPI003D8E61E3
MYLLQHLFPYALERDVIQDKWAVVVLDGDGTMRFLYTLGCDRSWNLRVYASAQILNASPYAFGRNVIRFRDAYFTVRAPNSLFPYALGRDVVEDHEWAIMHPVEGFLYALGRDVVGDRDVDGVSGQLLVSIRPWA